MIKIFKTDVAYAREVSNIVDGLLRDYPCMRINFDLEDEDRIMRIEGAFFKVEDIIALLKKYGHGCVELPLDLEL